MNECFHPLRAEDIPAAKALWKICFGDSDQYIDFFFERKFIPCNSLGLFLDGRLAADLFMQEKTLVLQGCNLRTGFLAGCATHPDFQKKGYMRKLLQRELEVMCQQGYALCALHPFLHAFYRKFGWETASYMVRVALPAAKPASAVILQDDVDCAHLLSMYQRYMLDAQGYFARSLEDMRCKIDEHCADGGKILKTDEYYAFYDVLEDHIDVTENTCRSERECYDMAERLSGYQLPLNFWLPVHIKTAIPAQQACEYTMFRICNPAEFKDLCGDRNIFKPVDNMEKSKTASQQAIRALFENPLKNAYVFFDQF